MADLFSCVEFGNRHEQAKEERVPLGLHPTLLSAEQLSQLKTEQCASSGLHLEEMCVWGEERRGNGWKEGP